MVSDYKFIAMGFRFLLIGLFLLLYNLSVAQVTIDPADATISEGTNPSCFSPTLSIEIRESAATDFANGANMIYSILLPAGFEFDGDASDIDISYVVTSGTSTYSAGTGTPSFTLINDPSGTPRKRKYYFRYTISTTGNDVGKIVLSNIKISCYDDGQSGYIVRDVSGVDNAIQNGNPYKGEVVGANPPANAYPALLSHGFLSSMTTIDASTNCNDYYYCPVFLTVGSPAYAMCAVRAISFSTPAVAGSTYNLRRNSTVVATSTTSSSFSYMPDPNLSGLHYYTIEVTNASGCKLQSDTIDFNFSPGPAAATYNTSRDTIFPRSAAVIALSNYVTAAAGSTINSFSGPGVFNTGGTSYVFDPGSVITGEHQIYYEAARGTCTKRYPFPYKFTVYDPLEAPPSYITAKLSSNSGDPDISPPFCENTGIIYVTFHAPAGMMLRDVYLYRRTSGTVSVSGLNTATYGPIAIDPKRDDYNGRLYTYIYFSDGTNPEDSDYGYITIFPERNPQLLGFPAHTGDTISVCTVGKDSVIYHAAPAGGQFIFEKYKSGTYTTISSVGQKPIGAPDDWYRAFVPETLYKTQADTDQTVHFKITYIYPPLGLSFCPDTVINYVKFSTPINVDFTITSPLDSPFCFGEALQLQINGNDSLDRFYWNFGDGTSRENDSLTVLDHNYSLPGMYQLRFKTIADTLLPNTCDNDILDTLYIGAKPIASFDVYKNYEQTSTVFHSTAVLNAINKTTSADSISKWIWRYDDLANTIDTAVNADTMFTYSLTRKTPYAITHKVVSGWGCADSVVRHIPVFPIKVPTVTAAALDTFNASDVNGWFQSEQYQVNLVSSWQNRTPPDVSELALRNQVPVQNISGLTGDVWITSLNASDSTATYYSNEKSYVESPVYKLDSIDLAMVSLSTFNNFDNLLDGAALQYTFCDSIAFGKETWYTLGKYNEGLNWYNSSTILGQPGNTYVGWTNDTLRNWQTSAYRLSELLDSMELRGRKLVRFRIVLGTNGDNIPIANKTFQGFAFDNFFVGQRNRKVLVEEFCDYVDYEEKMKDVLVDPQAVRVQYHVRSRRLDDPINNLNRGENGARQLYYGLWDIPVGVLDGIYKDHKRPFLTWGENDFFKRSLVQAPFDVTISKNINVAEKRLEISTTVSKNSDKPLPGPFLLHTIIVERIVVANSDSFTNVFRSFVPNAAGHRIVKPNWATGPLNAETRSGVWTPYVNPSSDLLIISFIQDDFTKEVYQVNIDSVDVADAQSIYNPLRKGNEEMSGKAAFEEATLFPNPSSGQLSVLLDGITTLEHPWEVSDAFGRIVLTGTLPAGINLEYLDVSMLNAGLYQFSVASNSGKIVKPFSVVK